MTCSEGNSNYERVKLETRPAQKMYRLTLSQVQTRTGNLEHNSYKRMIFKKYYKRDGLARQGKQLLFKYFPNSFLVFNIVLYESDHVTPVVNGLKAVIYTYM